MATYKLIQDVEAEDHILGPFTLRQFIFMLAAAFLYWMSVLIYQKGAVWLLIVFLPPALFCTFFAIPFGRDQPTEIWALAKIRFYLKPRRRIWDQSGMKQLVTVTAPKKTEPVLTDGLSQTEVQSRLNALANTLDSRGWAIKNVNLNAFSPPNPLLAGSSDRLIDINSIPNSVPNYDVRASDDILDEYANPVAQQFDQMIDQSSREHRQQLINQLNNPMPAASQAPPADYWFMNQTGRPPAGQAVFSGSQFVQPGAVSTQAAQDDPALSNQLKNRRTVVSENANLRTLQPMRNQQSGISNQPAAANGKRQATNGAASDKPAAPDPAILSLANNNDLNVATLARQANKAKGDDELRDEVVVSLH